MAGSPKGEVERLEALAWLLLILAGAAGIWAALSRGTWLDEFWSLYLAAPGLPVRDVLPRWLSDNHPPLPNLLYRLALAGGGGGVAVSRILLNLPPLLGLAAATALFRRASASRSPFYLVLAIIAVSLPGFATAFSELRSYAWQICAFAVFAQLTYFLTADRGREGEGAALAAGAIATLLSICLHFVNGLIASVAAGLLILHLVRSGNRRHLAIVGSVAAVAWIVMAGIVAVQLPRMLAVMDYKWIGTTTVGALGLFGGALGVLVLANPVAAWSAIQNRAQAADDRFVRLVLFAAGASGLLLLLVNAARPIIIDRYILAWQMLLASAVAALAAPVLAGSRTRYALFLGTAAAAILIFAFLAGQRGGWEASRDRIAAAVKSCPETAVYAITPWRMGPGRHSHEGLRETQVFALGYRRMAAEGGFAVTLVPDAASVLPLAGPCPTLLWVEHAGYGAGLKGVLDSAGLRFSRPARMRIIEGKTGFVIAAEPLAASGPLR